MQTSTVVGFPMAANGRGEGRDLDERAAVALVVGLAHASEALVKVILVTGYLDDAEGRSAMQIAAASDVIRTLDDALAMIEAGANRLGTSATAEILGELRMRRGEI